MITAISSRLNAGPWGVQGLLLLVVLLLVAGCDTLDEGGEGTITLPPEQIDFRFEFDGSTASQQASSEESFDLAEVLPLAYTKDEVQRVTVASVELMRVSPAGRNLGDFLQQATFALDGAGASQSVATLTDPPDARSSAMTVSSENVTGSVTGNAFGGVLQITLSDVPSDLVLRVRVDLRIEVLDV